MPHVEFATARALASVRPRACPDPMLPPLPKHSQRPVKGPERDGALRKALLHGTIRRPLGGHEVPKPAPVGYEANWSHLNNCTACANAAAWQRSVRMSMANVAVNVRHELLDEAVLHEWSDVVHELETPRKYPVSLDGSDGRLAPLRMPGSVIYDSTQRVYRMWADQFTQRYLESRDGVTFGERKESPLRWAHERASSVGSQRLRSVRANTFTVTLDPAAPEAERYKAALHCDADGHVPDSARPTDAPLYRGKRLLTWESTCLAYSSDGGTWHMYELGHRSGRGPPQLRMAGDTANAIYRDPAGSKAIFANDESTAGTHGKARGKARDKARGKAREHGVLRVVNRWNVPLRPGTHGTPAPNPNWWREVRGVRISSRDDGSVTGGKGGWRTDAKWYFDLEGKGEHLQRQVYSLQVRDDIHLPYQQLASGTSPPALPCPASSHFVTVLGDATSGGLAWPVCRAAQCDRVA